MMSIEEQKPPECNYPREVPGNGFLYQNTPQEICKSVPANTRYARTDLTTVGGEPTYLLG